MRSRPLKGNILQFCKEMSKGGKEAVEFSPGITFHVEKGRQLWLSLPIPIPGEAGFVPSCIFLPLLLCHSAALRLVRGDSDLPEPAPCPN